ncbi:MAG: hypothetical protein AAF629_26655, partial [Chloroflexota bacterium]
MPLSHANLETAIENGIRYLNQIQRPGGDFETITSSHPDLRTARAYPKSVYTVASVLHTLSLLESTAVIAGIQEKAVEFLLQEQTEQGAWRWHERYDVEIPADLNTTTCAIAALTQVQKPPELSFYALLWQNESTAGGPYYTWLDINTD